MDGSMNISHKFIDFTESKGDEKCNAVNREAIICVGSTGTGKSSLIKLYCGDNVKVGHSVNSETQGSTMFKESISDRSWLDSQGANDSQGVDDQKVLTDVLRTLYDNQITNIKVIWCVSGDFDRAKQEFHTQAKFIKSLGNGVWNSCLIIEKMGPTKPKKIDGVLEAARNKGSNIEYGNNRLFGYTGFDYMTDDDIKKDDKLQMIYEFTKPNSSERVQKMLKYGYLTNPQIIEQVSERLVRLSPLKLIFTVKKCEKCGIKGDPRFVYAPCHSQLEKYHPKSTEPYHEGKLIKIHTASLQQYHSGGLHTDISTEKYHPGEWKNFGLGIRGKWTCCKQKGTDDTTEEGCRERVKVGSTSWSCCGGSSGASGCKDKYACCGGAEGSDGCRDEWDCCGALKHSSGCKRRYKCCNADESEPNGCKDRCQSCHTAWGSSVGCIETTKQK